MLTVEGIREILERSSGGIVDVVSAAQAIYEAQAESVSDEWMPVSWECEDIKGGTVIRRETCIQQKRNGQVQREMLRNHHGEPVSVALCFVPGEGLWGDPHEDPRWASSLDRK